MLGNAGDLSVWLTCGLMSDTVLVCDVVYTMSQSIHQIPTCARCDVIDGCARCDVIDGCARCDVIDGCDRCDVIDGCARCDVIDGCARCDVIDGCARCDVIDGCARCDVGSMVVCDAGKCWRPLSVADLWTDV